MLYLLLACAPDEAPAERDGFTRGMTVRVSSPSNGETVESPFVLTFEAGRDVAGVTLLADSETVVAFAEPDAGEIVVELAEGSWELALVGLDASDAEVSRDALTVRVAAAGDPWVTITSPSDGAEVPNPVTFAVEASDEVDRVALSVDGYAIGEANGEGLLTYTFTGTGYERVVTAEAYAGDTLVATDTIAVTVTPADEPADATFNDVVMRYLEAYPTDGTHGYYWPEGDEWLGVTQDVWYQDTLYAAGDPYGRCYCVGLTFELYMRAFQELDRASGGDGSLNGMSLADLDEFRVDWFVRELDGDGAGVAFWNYGLGETLDDPFSDARPGDFVQFWRHSGSGHNNIFVEWVHTDDDGVPDGLTYWSTQSGTDGIGYNTEYFGSSGSRIDTQYLYVSRAWVPEDWIGWR
ncbi:MAG: Ig-like domain-containing protein [Myxococcota bacterium]